MSKVSQQIITIIIYKSKAVYYHDQNKKNVLTLSVVSTLSAGSKYTCRDPFLSNNPMVKYFALCWALCVAVYLN